MAEEKRVIFTGLCRGEISPENISIIGMIVISDKVRKNARETIGYFYSQGIDVKIISGDNAYAASTIAEKGGFQRYTNLLRHPYAQLHMSNTWCISPCIFIYYKTKER